MNFLCRLDEAEIYIMVNKWFEHNNFPKYFNDIAFWLKFHLYFIYKCSMIQVSYDIFTPKEIINSDYQISTLNLKNTIYLNYSNNEKLALSFTLV